MNMNRREFQQLANLRRDDARALLREGRFGAAYYMMGYAIECALKACIAKQTKRHDFPPDRKFVDKVYSHKLNDLATKAGLGPELEKAMETDRALALNWTTAKDWSEGARYNLTISKKQATDLCSACTARTHGILSWIKKRW